MRSEPEIRHRLGLDPVDMNRHVGNKASASAKPYDVVSLFSGCGGMDLGFMGGFEFGQHFYEKMPFRIIWANDLNPMASRTYEANLEHEIYLGDVAAVLGALPKKADVVIGGFPCQDVSINGSRKCADGKRTILYLHMVEAIRRTRPRIFVAENVKGLLQSHGREFFETMVADFESVGYRVNPRLYLAADYGVPQMRERLFIVGVRGCGEFNHPVPALTHVTAKEALADLESQPECVETGHIWSKAQRSPDQGNRRLKADRPATTIRAEHHGNVQWHYCLDRRLSLREAARLQSFPDEFRFHGGMRETERMIGNAVPPVLAWHIAKAVREFLDP